jgi:hypothetical protein
MWTILVIWDTMGRPIVITTAGELVSASHYGGVDPPVVSSALSLPLAWLCPLGGSVPVVAASTLRSQRVTSSSCRPSERVWDCASAVVEVAASALVVGAASPLAEEVSPEPRPRAASRLGWSWTPLLISESTKLGSRGDGSVSWSSAFRSER